MIRLHQESTIYILAPYQGASGGPEALHQLCYYLTQLEYRAKIAYYFYPDKAGQPTPEKYRQYGVSWCYLDDVPDDGRHLLISPEMVSFLLNGFSNIKKVVWWLSVDFYRSNQGINLLAKIIRHLMGLQWEKARQAAALHHRFVAFSDPSIRHFTASHYAFEYVQRRGAEQVSLLIEPLGLDFLQKVVYRHQEVDKQAPRNDVVLYNPAKMSRTMQRMLTEYPHWQYIPLQGFTADELIALMKKSKVYVDFGHFPGPERLPKEAAVCGCCILTGRRGAAAYYDDVRIPEHFKFSDTALKTINRQIAVCMSEYQQQIDHFAVYRQMVVDLEDNFKKQIQELFISAPSG